MVFHAETMFCTHVPYLIVSSAPTAPLLCSGEGVRGSWGWADTPPVKHPLKMIILALFSGIAVNVIIIETITVQSVGVIAARWAWVPRVTSIAFVIGALVWEMQAIYQT